MRQRWRGPLFVLAVTAILVGLLAFPAAAGPPVIDGPQPPAEFTDTDPCTGEDHDVSITVTFFDHFHDNGMLFRDGDRSGFTDSGYFLQGGQLHIVDHSNVELVNFTDIWRNPETGEMFVATGRVRFAGNSPVVVEFNLRCITGPTILP